MISVCDVIFNEKEVWDGRLIQRTPDEIKQMDEAIKILQVPESETEDIHLGEDVKDMELESTITHQADHEMDNLDTDAVVNKDNLEKQAEIDDFAWAEGQYSSPDPSILGAFLANSVGLPVENLFVEPDFCKSEEVKDLSHKNSSELENSFVAATTRKTRTLYDEHWSIPEPVVMDQLEKQQNERFFDFSQLRVPTKIQTAFTAGL